MELRYTVFEGNIFRLANAFGMWTGVGMAETKMIPTLSRKVVCVTYRVKVPVTAFGRRITRTQLGLIGIFRLSNGDVGEDGHVCVVLRGEV